VLKDKLAESNVLVEEAKHIQAVVSDDGSTYYFNTATQETSWEKPAQLVVLETTMAEMADAAVRQQSVSD
jgi:hypothetical protein